jgi:hypothetical protein
MSHDKVFVAFGHSAGTGGTAFVAIFGSTEGLTSTVFVDVVAMGPTVIFVEVFANGWSAVVVSVAVVAPVAITVDVATAIVGTTRGELKLKGCCRRQG